MLDAKTKTSTPQDAFQTQNAAKRQYAHLINTVMPLETGEVARLHKIASKHANELNAKAMSTCLLYTSPSPRDS